MRKDKFGYYYPAYRYYVSNAFRWYFGHPDQPGEETRPAQRENWSACDVSIKKEDPMMCTILKELYTSMDTMENAIFAASKKYDLTPERLWTKVGQLERRFAYERGLI